MLRELLEEAHPQGFSNACETSPYRKWLEWGGPCAREGNQGDSEDEFDQEDQQVENNDNSEDSDEGEDEEA